MPLLLWLALIPSWGLAQSPNVLPEAWQGHWEGRLHIYNAQGQAMELTMQLLIEPTDSAHRQNWTIVYLPDDTTKMKVDRRPYELVGLSDKPGHFLIDEQNSILLDCYLLDRVMSSRFRVNQSLLLINYTLLNEDSLRVEIFSGSWEPVRQSGEALEEIETVQAFGLGGYQRAMLRKK